MMKQLLVVAICLASCLAAEAAPPKSCDDAFLLAIVAASQCNSWHQSADSRKEAMNAAEASAQIAWAICEDPAWLAAGDVAKLAGDFQRLQGHAYYQSGQNGEADGSTHFQAGVLAYNAEDWVTAEAEFIISEIAYKSGKTQFVEADGFYFNAELYYIQADVLYMNGAP